MNSVKILSFFCLILFFSNCGNAPQIIHVKEYFYDEEGRLTSIREEEMDVDTFWTKDTFMYDSLNRKIAEERTGSQFKSPKKTTYQYDSDSEIVEKKITGGNDPFDKIFQYTYSDKKNKAGKKDRIEEKQYHIKNSTDTTLYSTILSKYNSFGYWTERTTTIHSQPDSVVFEKNEHVHNKYGNTEEDIHTTYENGEVVERFTILSHMVDGVSEIDKTIQYTQDEGVVICHEKHNKDHKRVELVATKDSAEIEKLKFDQNGRLMEWNDKREKWKRTYIYDSNRLVKEITTRTTE